jgi:NADPH:quinone reductase
MFAPDIALLVSLIADGDLKPVIGMERHWSELATAAELLRDRRINGKAVFHTGAG